MTNAETKVSIPNIAAWALLLGLAPLLAGCAAAQADASADVPNGAAIERGHHTAEVQCAQCHQIGPAGESPNPMAPAFRNIRMRYNFIGFKKRFAEMQADGHYEMPGFNISAADADDIAAYIDSYNKP
jgi:mono/diheme cytochrome c family protein